ncbi:MAG: exodeoxyribonuclease VII small subunit [Symbiobacteriaceae bacterium]|nr:exodeoxyribonuclease VII small subunit [Symbiobacteriaceae bacterium]
MTKPGKDTKELANLTFEEAMQQVEQLVRSLENNSLPLNETLAAFEQGVRLARFCQDYLDAAEKKIEQVIASAYGELELKPLVLEKE